MINNYIIGIFPAVSTFYSFKTLFLGRMLLSGTITKGVKLPSTMKDLSISSNFLDGGIPNSYGNTCSLRSLDMFDNNLSEEFPIIVWNLTGCSRNSLQELILHANKIKDTLLDFSIFATLKLLNLSTNELSGKIPEDNELPYKLKYLSIHLNTIECRILKAFGNAWSLLLFDMSYNNFNDELPKIISHISWCARYSLKTLSLGNNKINGTVTDFSTFTSLKILNHFENKLNEVIHMDIWFPLQLEALYMFSNSLKVVITNNHFAYMFNLQELYLWDNSLCLTFNQNWVPPFHLFKIGLRSCKLGPTFHTWLQEQNEFDDIDISNAAILVTVPIWF